MWEYRVEGINYTHNQNRALEEFLNSLGGQDWELVAITDTKAFFKRPREEPK